MIGRLLIIHRRLMENAEYFQAHFQEADFVKHCREIVSEGWKPKFDTIPSLKQFNLGTDSIGRYFTRLCLLKIIAEASYQPGAPKVDDHNWFRKMKENLETYFAEITQPVVIRVDPAQIRNHLLLEGGGIYTLSRWSRTTADISPEYKALVSMMFILLLTYALMAMRGLIPSVSLAARNFIFPTPEQVEAQQRQELKTIMSEPKMKEGFHVSEEVLRKLEGHTIEPK